MLTAAACQDPLSFHFKYQFSLGTSPQSTAPLTKRSCTSSGISLSLPKSCTSPFQTRMQGVQVFCQAVKKQVDEQSLKLKSDSQISVDLDNESDESQTIIKIVAPGRPGVLQVVISALKDLGLNVAKATVEYENGVLREKFWVQRSGGVKISDMQDLKNVQRVLYNALDEPVTVMERNVKRSPAKLYTKREFTGEESFQSKRRTDLLYRLMDQYLKNDVLSIQKSIVDHVEYTVARSRFRFDDFEAYQVYLNGGCGHPSCRSESVCKYLPIFNIFNISGMGWCECVGKFHLLEERDCYKKLQQFEL